MGTAAVPPVFLATWWHPSQAAPTLKDWNSQRVSEKQTQRGKKSKTKRLEMLMSPLSSYAPLTTPTSPSPPPPPPAASSVLIYYYSSCLVTFFLSFLRPSAVWDTLFRQVQRNSHREGGRRRREGGRWRREVAIWERKRSMDGREAKRKSFIRVSVPSPSKGRKKNTNRHRVRERERKKKRRRSR